MREDIDVSKIKKSDKVKVSLYGLPESDWLVVTRTSDSRHEDRVVLIETPDGSEVVVRAEEVAAHEPAAPALPDWWGSHVLAKGFTYLILNVAPDGEYYVDHVGTKHRPDDPLWWHGVSVVVDRDGNLPAAGMLEAKVTELAERNRSLSGELKIIRALPPAQEQAAAIVRDLKVERDDARKQVDFLSTAVRAEIDAAKSYEQERDQAREAYANLCAAVEKVRDKYHRANKRGGIVGSPVLDLTKALGDNQ